MAGDRSRVGRARYSRGRAQADHEDRSRGLAVPLASACRAATHRARPCRAVAETRQPLVRPQAAPAARAAADELLADLAEARRAEHAAAASLAQARRELAAIVPQARAAGVGYDRMAQVSLRAVHGQTIALANREREAARLRKLVQRRRVDRGHDFRSRKIEDAPPSEARSDGKDNITMEKLIKRTTIEETFATDGADEHRAPDDEREDDDLEGDGADDDEPDAAARKSRRR